MRPITHAARRRVLIVDDEPRLGKTLELLLADAHDVLYARSVDEARALLAREPDVDAILCDLLLDGESGMDLHAWIERAHPLLARRMIFMTGGAYTKAARDFLGRVPNPRLEKPFRIEDVEALLARIEPPAA